MSLYQDVRNVNEEELVEKIGKLLNDPKYRENAKTLSRKLKDDPFPPAERFVRLIEFAARHPKSDDLELHETKLNFVVRNHLDIYLPFIASLLTLIYVLFKLTQLLVRVSIYLLSMKQKQKIA